MARCPQFPSVERVGKVVRHEVLGALSYTDEDEAVSENVNVGGGMEKNACPLGSWR